MSPETIEQKIKSVFPDAKVSMDGEECNFSIVVESARFEGLSPIKCHRMVNDIFKSEFMTGELHALSIKTKAP